MELEEILYAIAAERERQDTLHPNTHSEPHLLAVLMEEVGEVAKAMQEDSNITEELIQVAAVAVRWLESRE
jgi:NTP pyrophosphatase (non-canonical NTP hydrolase)